MVIFGKVIKAVDMEGNTQLQLLPYLEPDWNLAGTSYNSFKTIIGVDFTRTVDHEHPIISSVICRFIVV